MNKRIKGNDKEIVESINTVVKDDYNQSGKTIKRCEEAEESVKKIRRELIAVSYTHLDVYKRQP